MRYIPRLSRSVYLILILVGASLCPLHVLAGPAIVLASTTSVEDSGLLGRILPLFTKTTGIEVRGVAQGTGQALETARRGDADLVLVHDPEAEQKFISEGYGVDRSQIAWNDFVIVGPKDDPAHIKGMHDAVAALKAIAAAKAPFVSRGDNSGTNALELRLWISTGIDPKKDGTGSWYRDIGGGYGPGAQCRFRDGCLYPFRSRYVAQLRQQGPTGRDRRGRSKADQPLQRDPAKSGETRKRKAGGGAAVGRLVGLAGRSTGYWRL